MSIDRTFAALFLDELKDLYDAEQQLLKALPKLAKAATDAGLKEAIEGHLRETENHLVRVERAFALLGEEPDRMTCPGIAGIIKEANRVIGAGFEGAILDAGLIASAQRAEHYEIGAYGSVVAWARRLAHNDVADLLAQTLDEEKAANVKLTQLGEGGINEAAVGHAA